MTDLLERVAPRSAAGGRPGRQVGVRVRALAERVGGWLPGRPVPPASSGQVAGPARASDPPAKARTLSAAGAALATVAGAVALAPSLPGAWAATPAAVAASTAVLLVVVTALARTARRAAIVCVATACVAIAALVAVGPKAAGLQPLSGAGWFGQGWRDLAAAPLPAAPTSPAVAAVAVAAAVAAALAVTAASQPGVGLSALLPGTALFVAAAVVGAGTPTAAVVFVAGIAAHLMATGHEQRGHRLERSRWRLGSLWRLGAAVTVFCCCAAIAVPVSALMPPATRAPSAAPTQVLDSRSPLTWVGAWQNQPGTTVFSVDEVSGPLRWVSLDDYDTTTWTTSGRYRLAGAAPEVAVSTAGPGTATQRVHAQVSGLRLPGPWLVSPGRPIGLEGAASDGSGLLIDATGDLATAAGAPARYRVSAVVERPSEEVLRAVEQRPRTADEVGAVADEAITARAEQAVAGTSSDLDRLAALAQWSRTNLWFDPKALPGQSLRTLSQVSDGSRGGTMDQIAASYALMARSLGYPSRVVVGFTPAKAGAVSSADVVAWPEVWLDGVGWQPFYPVPLRGVTTEHEIHREQTAAAESAAAPGPSQTPSVDPAADDPNAEATPTQEVGTGLIGLLGAAAAVVSVGGIAGWRLRRRRLRTAGTTGDRVLRAWVALQRSLSRRGVRQVRTLTADELVDRVAQRWGAAAANHVRELADLATAVLFAGAEPSQAQAQQAWQLLDHARRALSTRHRAGRTAKPVLVTSLTAATSSDKSTVQEPR